MRSSRCRRPPLAAGAPSAILRAELELERDGREPPVEGIVHLARDAAAFGEHGPEPAPHLAELRVIRGPGGEGDGAEPEAVEPARSGRSAARAARRASGLAAARAASRSDGGQAERVATGRDVRVVGGAAALGFLPVGVEPFQQVAEAHRARVAEAGARCTRRSSRRVPAGAVGAPSRLGLAVEEDALDQRTRSIGLGHGLRGRTDAARRGGWGTRGVRRVIFHAAGWKLPTHVLLFRPSLMSYRVNAAVAARPSATCSSASRATRMTPRLLVIQKRPGHLRGSRR